MARTPSSSVAGFFQTVPVVENQYHEDATLRRILNLFLPASVLESIDQDLSRFGQKVLSTEVMGDIADAERNPPYLQTWDTWGKRRDKLVTSNGWKRLQDLGIREGIVAIGYEGKQGQFSRTCQFAKYHLWQGSSAMVTCPSAMTDGAARLLSRHVQDASLPIETKDVLRTAFTNLTSRDPATAWTSGQWMTERAGGSDVSGTQTIATLLDDPLKQTGKDSTGASLGPYSISGFKWFSSATDSQMAVLLAQTTSGVSAFYAPMYREPVMSDQTEPTVLNGIRIQRLKSKLGTRALPTAEIELEDMRAYLLGIEGSGVKEISTILNITRVYNAVSAVGNWGRGLAISRAFARVRKAGPRLLTEVPAHMYTLATQHVEYRSYMLLTFFVVSLLGASESAIPSPLFVSSSPTLSTSGGTGLDLLPTDLKHSTYLLRLLTPLTKAKTARAAIAGLAECMESLGGVGYLDSIDDQASNIARLFRDTNVLSIWEGTTDIMADDMVRVLKGRDGTAVLDAMQKWVEARLESADDDKDAHVVQKKRVSWETWRGRVEDNNSEILKASGRQVMSDLAWFVCGLLLDADAEHDSDPIASETARRWWEKRGTSLSNTGPVQETADTVFRGTIYQDRMIVFGKAHEIPKSRTVQVSKL